MINPRKRSQHNGIAQGGIILQSTTVSEAGTLKRIHTKRTGFRGRALKSFKAHWQLYLLVFPPLLFFLIFKYYPMANAVLAFKDFNVVKGIWGSPWVGTKHFDAFFENPIFWTLLKNTLLLSLFLLLAGFPIPILLALMLNEVRSARFKKFVQLVTFAPYFISTVVMVSIIMLFLAPRLGFANVALQYFGLEPINFLGEPGMFRSIYVISDIWQTAGYAAVIYLAALAGIDPTLYEAAEIDGATRWQKMRYITLPSLATTVILLATLSIGNILNAGFDQIFNLYNPLVYASGDVIDTYVYRVGLVQAQYGFATAVGLLKSVIGFVLIVLSYRLAYRFANYRIF